MSPRTYGNQLVGRVGLLWDLNEPAHLREPEVRFQGPIFDIITLSFIFCAMSAQQPVPVNSGLS